MSATLAPFRTRAEEPLAVATFTAAEMQARAPAWDRLVAASCDPNPHFGRGVIAAHLAHGIASERLRFLSVVEGDAIRALLPFMLRHAFVGRLRPAHAVFASPYVTAGTPLVAGSGFERSLDALVSGLAQAGSGLWLWPSLEIDSRTGQGVLEACRRRGWPTAVVSSFDRAVLDRRATYAAYAEAALSKERRKGLARRRKRLEALGPLAHVSHAGGPGLAQAVEDFLALEAGGWKGAVGTALACRPGTSAFARAWLADADGPVRPRADVLTLAGQPVAVSLALVCGGTAYLLKTAYDEAYRAYAPGLLLEDAIVRALHDTAFADRLDSAAGAGHVLEELYPDRVRIADVLVATDAAVPPSRLAGWAAEERRRRALLDLLKRSLPRLRSIANHWAARVRAGGR